jgi:hypothetical protein
MIQQVRCSACGNLHRIEINAVSNRLLTYECPKTHKKVIFYPNISETIAILSEPFNPSNRESK